MSAKARLTGGAAGEPVRSRSPKRAVLLALQLHPDFAPLASLRNLKAGKVHDLLRWMDQSGLALSFLQRLETHETTALISSELYQALRGRRERNIARTWNLLSEFRRVNEAFLAQGVTLAALKGFTLVPDFCEAAHLRHQVDFDFLVDPADIDAAAAALLSCGYRTARLSRTGESCFTTPLLRVPSDKDDLYAIQQHRQVDLHTSIWEDTPWMSLKGPDDCLRYATRQYLHGAPFNRLSLEDTFLVQVFHAFRHSFRSWVRLSWLLEISRFLEIHQHDEAFWRRAVNRAGEELTTKRAFALVLGLATRLFHNAIPLQLKQWTAKATTDAMSAWLDNYSVNWSISDWPGSLSNVLLASEFIPDRKLRAYYWKSRLLPRKTNLSIGAMKCRDASTLSKFGAGRLRYLGKRSVSHLKCLLLLAVEELRWRRSLRAFRRGRPGSHDEAAVGEVS
jgi:hypothetical protein